MCSGEWTHKKTGTEGWASNSFQNLKEKYQYEQNFPQKGRNPFFISFKRPTQTLLHKPTWQFIIYKENYRLILLRTKL